MSVAIYSALYGPYEWPKPLPDLGVPGYMFTDDPNLEAPGWVTVYEEPDPFQVTWCDPAATVDMMRHKYWKTHPAEALEEDISIWLDASMEVTDVAFVNKCLEALGDDDWVAVPHPWRNCIYTEAEYSATLPRYDKGALDRQAAWYRDIGHPGGWGLFATGANVRRHTATVIKLAENWWQECLNWSHQDQVSLPVLFRLEEELKWNTKMPWGQWWVNHPHGR